MIRVTVELISAGDPSRSRVLGIAEISNDLEASIATDGELGNYNVRLSKWDPKTDENWKRGRVIGFPRKRLGGWDLLYQALRATVGYRSRQNPRDRHQRKA